MQSKKNKLILIFLEILSWGGTAMLIVGVLTHLNELRGLGLGGPRVFSDPVLLAWGFSGCILRMKFKEYKDKYKMSENFKPFGITLIWVTGVLITLGVICLFMYL
jgi:hypothetical protein